MKGGLGLTEGPSRSRDFLLKPPRYQCTFCFFVYFVIFPPIYLQCAELKIRNVTAGWYQNVS